MGESNYQWSMLLKKYVDKQISTEELAELHRQMNSSIFKREQFEQVTAEGYFPQSLANLLAIDPEEDMKRFAKKLDKHISSDENMRSKDKKSASLVDHVTKSKDPITPNIEPMQTSVPVVSSWQKKYVNPITIAAAILLISVSIATIYFSDTNTNLKHPSNAVTQQSLEDRAIKPYSYIMVENKIEIRYNELNDGVLLDSNGIVITKEKDRILIDTNKEYRPDRQLSFYLVTAAQTLQKLRLPNGTQIILDAASYIDLTPYHSRAVRIYGQAFCEVDPKAKERFSVLLTDNLRVEVTGTQFNIRNYKNEQPIVALKKGEIKLSKGDQSYVMHPGEEVEWTKDQKFRSIVNAKVDNELYWTGRELNIENKNIYQVMSAIGTYYNYSIRFADSNLPDKSAVGKISIEENVGHVTPVIEVQYDVKIQIKKDSLIVFNK